MLVAPTISSLLAEITSQTARPDSMWRALAQRYGTLPRSRRATIIHRLSAHLGGVQKRGISNGIRSRRDQRV